VSKVLLTILNETLNETTEEMKSTQATLEEHKARVQDVREELRRATSQHESALYEYKQATQRKDVLSTYLSCPGEHPGLLRDKMKKLSDEWDRAAQSRAEADRLLVHVRTNLQGRQRDLAMAEEYYAKLQEGWRAVSALIESLQRIP
jgi:hypothetical protein